MTPPRPLPHALAFLLALLLWTSHAFAQDAPYVAEAAQARERAKSSYNKGEFEQAAQDFLLSAQIDPGAAKAGGSPYRDLARCFFFLENYEKSVFWYDVYLKNWPKSADHTKVADERAVADQRRSRSGKSIALSSIYDRTLLELIDTLRERVDQGAPAYTSDGGGTARLYFQAIQQGYAMPDLAPLAKKLRARLLDEIQLRWRIPEDAPMPRLGSDAEPLEFTRQRLANLRSLAPTPEEMIRIDAWQRLLDAWSDLENELYDKAAPALLDAWQNLPAHTYLPYTAAVCLLRTNRFEEALDALQRATDKAPARLHPYHDLLRAEIYLAQGRIEPAAEIFWRLGTTPTPKN